jgi:hypothetical protein
MFYRLIKIFFLYRRYIIPSQKRRNDAAYRNDAASGANQGEKNASKMIFFSVDGTAQDVTGINAMAFPAIVERMYTAMAFLPRTRDGVAVRR